MLDIDTSKETCKKLLDELRNANSENKIDLIKKKMEFHADQIERENKDIAHTLAPINPFTSTSFHDNKYDQELCILHTIQKLDDLKVSNIIPNTLQHREH